MTQQRRVSGLGRSHTARALSVLSRSPPTSPDAVRAQPPYRRPRQLGHGDVTTLPPEPGARQQPGGRQRRLRGGLDHPRQHHLQPRQPNPRSTSAVAVPENSQSGTTAISSRNSRRPYNPVRGIARRRPVAPITTGNDRNAARNGNLLISPNSNPVHPSAGACVVSSVALVAANHTAPNSQATVTIRRDLRRDSGPIAWPAPGYTRSRFIS